MVEFDVNENHFEYKPKYQVFHSLMKHRIKEILLVSSIYDNFILEEDGRLSDQIYAEFLDLNLRTLPHFTRVSSAQEAFDLYKKREFDLVITMRRLYDSDPFEFGQQIKKIRDIPVVLLLTSLSEINYLPDFTKKREGIDLTLLWNGDSAIFISLTKLLEDRLNVEEDTKNGLVRTIIIIEHSIRFYSLYLPLIYGEIMRQVQYLIQEGLNDYYRLLQMKARPKIILTHTYEEAMEYYKKYKDFIIGIISEVEFPRNNVMDKNAGIDFLTKIRKESPTIPAILQSNNSECRKKAEEIQAHFIHKKSKSLLKDIREFMLQYMGFGDFIFRLENGEQVGKASNLHEFKEAIRQVPLESLYYHASHDNFSGWLMARGEFHMASILKSKHVNDFESKEAIRDFLHDSTQFLIEQKKRIVVDFRKDSYHPDSNFIRLRPGSLGGKGRGLAFMMFLLDRFDFSLYRQVDITIPQTIAIGTDEFDNFMEQNNLHRVSQSQDLDDQEIYRIFKKAKLSHQLKEDLKFILKDWQGYPIAVRSSSIVEDSQFQPFAGIFGTYMLSNQEKSLNVCLERVCEAIKLVYASTFSQSAKSIRKAMGLRIDEVKMGVLVQKVVGKKYSDGKYFYPNFSGTASSFNYYPIGKMKFSDGIASLALGLGRIIVNGGKVRSFIPTHPKVNFFSSVQEIVKNSQNEFFAIDLTRKVKQIADEESYLVKMNILEAKDDENLDLIADTYNHENDVIQSGLWENNPGFPVITFNRQLLFDKTFPLPEILLEVLKLGEKTMGSPVEIEFACNFQKNPNEKHSMNLLQIRPSFEIPNNELEEIESLDIGDALAYTDYFSGNSIFKNIRNIVYIKSSSFDNLKTLEMANEIDYFNRKLTELKQPYLLIVFGRLGTFDRFLGIPVKEYNITGAKVIIETGTKDFQIEPSQGTHFFQNMISAKTGFLYIRNGVKNEFLDWEWVKNCPIAEEKQFFAHVELSSPLFIVLDGKKKLAVVKKQKN